MDEQTLVKYMFKEAKKDMFNGKGRIILQDFIGAFPSENKPTVVEMLQAWRKLEPEIPIDWRMNVLIINFAGGPSKIVSVEQEEVYEEDVCVK